MRKTLNVEERLFAEAKAACGARTDTEVVHLALEAVVRLAGNEILLSFRGSEPDATDVPRRREEPSPKRRVA